MFNIPIHSRETLRIARIAAIRARIFFPPLALNSRAIAAQIFAADHMSSRRLCAPRRGRSGLHTDLRKAAREGVQPLLHSHLCPPAVLEQVALLAQGFLSHSTAFQAGVCDISLNRARKKPQEAARSRWMPLEAAGSREKPLLTASGGFSRLLAASCGFWRLLAASTDVQ